MLHINGVTCEADGRGLLEGVSLCLEAGELVGLIGPSGGGKSALLRAIAGALPLSQGEISWQGRSLSALGRRELARWTAYVSPLDAPSAGDRVEKVVASGQALRRGNAAEDAATVQRVLEQLELEPLRDRAFGSLSGGERQRVLLGRGLAQDTPILLLDGAETGLDARACLELPGLLRSTGRTVLAVFHDLTLAAGCDHLCALREGRLAAFGTPEQVLTPELLGSLYRVQAQVSRDREGLFVRLRRCEA